MTSEPSLSTTLDDRHRSRVAFVLGGGGNLGALQVGMLRALHERKIRPDVVIGCSAGAINGAGYAADPTLEGIERLEQIWKRLEDEDVMPGGWLPSAVQLARKGDAVHDSDALRDLIERVLPVQDFKDLYLPFHCVATSIDDSDERWFSEGSLIEPLLASSAIPALYPIVTIEGERFMDGGVVNDVPISKAVELGASTIYVLHVGHYDRPLPAPRRPFEVAMMAYWIARRQRYLEDLRTLPPHIEAIVLPAGTAPDLRYNDFSRSVELITQAYGATCSYLDGDAASYADDPSRPALVDEAPAPVWESDRTV